MANRKKTKAVKTKRKQGNKPIRAGSKEYMEAQRKNPLAKAAKATLNKLAKNAGGYQSTFHIDDTPPLIINMPTPVFGSLVISLVEDQMNVETMLAKWRAGDLFAVPIPIKIQFKLDRPLYFYIKMRKDILPIIKSFLVASFYRQMGYTPNSSSLENLLEFSYMAHERDTEAEPSHLLGAAMTAVYVDVELKQAVLPDSLEAALFAKFAEFLLPSLFEKKRKQNPDLKKMVNKIYLPLDTKNLGPVFNKLGPGTTLERKTIKVGKKKLMTLCLKPAKATLKRWNEIVNSCNVKPYKTTLHD